MTELDCKKIVSIVDDRLLPQIEIELSLIGVSSFFVAGAKQHSLVHSSLRSLLPARPKLQESRSSKLVCYAPAQHSEFIMRRMAAAADLSLPGRGFVYSQDVRLLLNQHQLWNEDTLNAAAENSPAARSAAQAESSKAPSAAQSSPYHLICCIVQRGNAEALARALLELGLCVPVVNFGEGVGLRDRLGLLRITIPARKELLWCVVPPHDSSFVLDTLVRKAGLDEPGKGFLYRAEIQALAVNNRIFVDSRKHVASMEQVIMVLDELRGSTDWRRYGGRSASKIKTTKADEGALYRFSIISEEGQTSALVQASLNAGAGGATKMTMRAKGDEAAFREHESHAKERSDLIVVPGLVEPLKDVMQKGGLFNEDSLGMIELSRVVDLVTYQTPHRDA